MGALSDAIDREFGVPTEPRVNPETGMVGTSIVKVLGNNPNRFSFVIVNLGTAAVFLAPDNAVATTRGIRLDASGGSFSANWRDDANLTGWDWYAIAEAAGQSVLVLEVVAR